MTKDPEKNIFFHNVFYMLSYAFDSIHEEDRRRIDGEEFDNIADLFAEILYLGMSRQIHRGLHKQFKAYSGPLLTIKGRIDFPETLRLRTNGSLTVECDFDEFSEDNIFNRIIKLSFKSLLGNPDVKKERKRQLKTLEPFIAKVSEIDYKTIDWKSLVYQRNNRDYRLIINVCRFYLDEMMLSTADGKKMAPIFSDKHMETVYERFLLNYYKREHKEVTVNADILSWDILDEDQYSLLPSLKTDVTIRKGNSVLIIDAKYYGDPLSHHYHGKSSFHREHLSQIRTYVAAADQKYGCKASGVVLYAQPKGVYQWDDSVMTTSNGNRFSMRLLDLSRPFVEIRLTLDGLLNSFIDNSTNAA